MDQHVFSRRRSSFRGGGSESRRSNSKEKKLMMKEHDACGGGHMHCSQKVPPHGGGESRYSVSHFISRVYYRLGLLCATHPRFVLILTFFVIIWSCFPLLSLPIYSTRPQIHQQSVRQLSVGEEHHQQPNTPGIKCKCKQHSHY